MNKPLNEGFFLIFCTIFITRGVQIQSNPIKTAKPIQSKSKTDQNCESFDLIWILFFIDNLD